QDTDFDTTPRKLGMGWAVKMDKSDFVGKAGLQRISTFEMDRKLAPIRFDNAAPPEGAQIVSNGEYAGHLTSSRFSPALRCGVALAWLRRGANGKFPEHVTASGGPEPIVGHVTKGPFYDPEGAKLRA